MIKRQIFAMGGGGFSMEPENPLLDDYMLTLVPKDMPKIAFIGTASGDAQDYIDRFYASFETKNCIPSHLSLFKGNQLTLETYIFNQDIVYVGGGNTRNMLVLWKEWGLNVILKKAYQKGIVLSGLSAGAICWFEQGLTDSLPGALSKINGLGILQGSNCPHFDGEPERQNAYKSKIALGEMKAGIACDDGVGLLYVNEELVHVVSSRQGAKAYSFTSDGKYLTETSLAVTQLNLAFKATKLID